jgi:hypothetical protein
MKTALCLFEHSKTFASLYESLGYNVVSVDLELGIDIMLFDYKAYSNVDTIIAHPPCTEFAVSGARWWVGKPKELLENAVQLVYKTLEIIEYHKPRVWFIENPIGRLEKCVPEMRNFPKTTFNPFQYAGYADLPENEAYTKKTVLWGVFTIPKVKPLEPVLGSKMWSLGWRTPEVQRQRSITPQGFARAFVEANKEGVHYAQEKLF